MWHFFFKSSVSQVFAFIFSMTTKDFWIVKREKKKLHLKWWWRWWIKKNETEISSLNANNNKGCESHSVFFLSRTKIYIQIQDLLGFRYKRWWWRKGLLSLFYERDKKRSKFKLENILCWVSIADIYHFQFKLENRFHHYCCSLLFWLIWMCSLGVWRRFAFFSLFKTDCERRNVERQMLRRILFVYILFSRKFTST